MGSVTVGKRDARRRASLAPVPPAADLLGLRRPRCGADPPRAGKRPRRASRGGGTCRPRGDTRPDSGVEPDRGRRGGVGGGGRGGRLFECVKSDRAKPGGQDEGVPQGKKPHRPKVCPRVRSHTAHHPALPRVPQEVSGRKRRKEAHLHGGPVVREIGGKEPHHIADAARYLQADILGYSRGDRTKGGRCG